MRLSGWSPSAIESDEEEEEEERTTNHVAPSQLVVAQEHGLNRSSWIGPGPGQKPSHFDLNAAFSLSLTWQRRAYFYIFIPFFEGMMQQSFFFPISTSRTFALH